MSNKFKKLNPDYMCTEDGVRIGDTVRFIDKVTHAKIYHTLSTQEELDEFRKLFKDPTSGER